MSRILDVNNYLFISPKKIGISVNENKDFSEIYKKEIHISEKTNQIKYFGVSTTPVLWTANFILLYLLNQNVNRN